jgi:hypothetical protein
MPSPKGTRRASKSKSPNRGTRRGAPARPATTGFMSDPFLQAMMRGDILWGDIMTGEVERHMPAVSPRRSPRSKSPKAVRAPPPSPRSPSPKAKSWNMMENVLEDFETPNLRALRGIWEHFPVIVEPAGRGRFSVRWHKKNLEAWRSSRTKSWDEAMEYQLFSELRLLHTLRKHPELYALHEPSGKDEIVVIEPLGGVEMPAPAAAAAVPRGPELRKLNDITKFFPGIVVWNPVEGRRGESTYALKVRGDFERKHKGAEGRAMLAELESALRTSRFWAVLPARGAGEWLRLEMRHD